jgi:hypothetical protein
VLVLLHILRIYLPTDSSRTGGRRFFASPPVSHRWTQVWELGTRNFILPLAPPPKANPIPFPIGGANG